MIYVLSDGTVTAKEAEGLVATYFVYVAFMAFNQSIMNCIDSCTGKKKDGHMELDGKDGDDDDDEDSGPISKAVAAPLTILFDATIPDCTKEGKKGSYLITFLMSIFWIGV